MPKVYEATSRGHRVEVEADNSLFVVTRLRLLLDGFRADERGAVWGDVRLHGELPDDPPSGPRVWPVTVEVSVGLLGNVRRCVLLEGGAEYPLTAQGVPPRPAPKERELLEALRAERGRITPTLAALATSLSVEEADGMLSDLAGGGHLSVEREGGSLVYSLPGKAGPGLEAREGLPRGSAEERV